MPVVPADVVKLARRVLPRLLEQRGLVEPGPDRVCRPRHHSQMSEADLPVSQGIHCLLQLRHQLADGNPIRCGRTGHVAVDADPVDRSDRAFMLVFVGSGKLGSFLGERELHQVDDMALTDEPLTAVLSGQTYGIDCIDCINVLRREHKNMLPNSCSPSQCFWAINLAHNRPFFVPYEPSPPTPRKASSPCPATL